MIFILTRPGQGLRTRPRSQACRIRSTAFVPALLVLLLAGAAPAKAFTFLSADDSSIDEAVNHQIGYQGTGGSLEITVGLDPITADLAQFVIPTINTIDTWNELTPQLGNIERGALPFRSFDFESVLIHEMGHAMGLDHPNLASESGLPQADRDFVKSRRGPNNTFDLDAGADGILGSNDDLRGDDVNLQWFRSGLNDPFAPLPAVVDSTTFSRDPNDLPAGDGFAAAASVEWASERGDVPDLSEAVMHQGTLNAETQRELGHDDVAGILFARSGLDSIAGTADDYTATLRYVGPDADADIVIGFDANTPFASTQRSGSFLGGNDFSLSSAEITFNPIALADPDGDFEWFFNDVADTDTHAWASSSASGVWEQGENWATGELPNGNWIVELANQTDAAQTSIVQQDQWVWRVEVAGPGATHTVRVDTGVTLHALESTDVAAGGVVDVRGTLDSPALTLSGGVLSGDGEVVGAVTNSDGSVEPGNSIGELRIDGRYTQGAAGRLVTGIGSAGHDELTVTGPATLAGELTLDVEDGYIPPFEASFPLLSASAIDGIFDAIEGVQQGDRALAVTFGATHVEATVTLPGNANLDQSVDVIDLGVLGLNFGADGLRWLDGDFNGDTLIDVVDLGILGLNFGSTLPANGAAVVIPEPGTFALLTAALPLLLRRRR